VAATPMGPRGVQPACPTARELLALGCTLVGFLTLVRKVFVLTRTCGEHITRTICGQTTLSYSALLSLLVKTVGAGDRDRTHDP
jgi:hypothetical protein